MTVFYLMTQVPVKSHTFQNLLFRSHLYTHLFGTLCKTCLEHTYILKYNYTLVEEIGFFGSKKMSTMDLAGKFFKNTLYLYLLSSVSTNKAKDYGLVTRVIKDKTK